MRLSWFPTVAAVLAVLGGCPRSDGADETPKEERAFSVAVEVAGSGTVADPVQVTGTIHPKRDVVVAAEGSGRVVDVAVSLGHIVARGAVLATLDSVVQRAQLDQAEAGLREAKAVFALSEAGFKREETLAAGGATTPQEHFRSGAELERAQAGVDAARARVALAQRAVADASIRAPFEGTIAARQIEVGALVGPGTPAFRLVDMTRVVVSAGIPAREITRVEAGQAVAMHVPAVGIDVPGGLVTHVGPQPDPRTRSYPAEVEVSNEDGSLRSGMVARVDIIVGERGAVLVPEEAVVEDEPPHVFILENQRARRSDLVLGRLVDGFYEVRSGVADGDHVATLGKQHLSDGVKVAPYDLPKTTAATKPSVE
jgi:membrane fusion protein, multidrug efflux system